MSEPIFVHIDIDGSTHFMGRLWTHVTAGHESASFEPDARWVANSGFEALKAGMGPGLGARAGVAHTGQGQKMFGVFGDAAPDRWGRALMNRAEARRARKENVTPRTLKEKDYLLGVSDAVRMGAVRFSKDGQAFMSQEELFSEPIELARLLASAEKIENKKERDEDIRDLLASGSSMGGARPKASITDSRGRLVMAKFPSVRDDWDVAMWEYVSLKIARFAGIKTPPFEYRKIAGRGVLLTERFDRDENGLRIPYVSAMSRLGYNNGDRGSYIEIAETFPQDAAHRREDLRELWTRIMLNMVISNHDDHLRNHGFLFQSGSWRLSPVFDLEPEPIDEGRPRRLHTHMGFDDVEATLDEALSVAEEFGLGLDEARGLARKIAEASLCNWRRWGKEKGASPREMDRMSDAFEHAEARKALHATASFCVTENFLHPEM